MLYIGSEEEVKDIFHAYEQCKGDMNAFYDYIILLNLIDDDDRIRGILTKAITEKKIKEYARFTKETNKQRQKRLDKAREEAKEAEKLKEELNLAYTSASGESTKDTSLGALLKQRSEQRMSSIIESIEAKYAKKTGMKGQRKESQRKRKPETMPSEEEFEALQTKLFKNA